MTTIDTSHRSLGRTLGDLVAERPARARVLERLGIDYCCHGHRSLLDATTEAGLDAVTVAAELAQVAAVVTEIRDDLVPHLAKEEQVYRRLEHLEVDTHQHVHLENNVLFPAVTSDES